MSKNFDIKLETVKLKNLVLQAGVGGLHSVDESGIFTNENNFILLDADIISFYPQSIINYDICPEHLDKEIFKQIIIDTLKDRKTYKKKKKENVIYAALEYGMKISLNSVYGLFAYANFLLYDLLCTYKTTINNQLWILKLIEILLINDINIISVNTDGILIHTPNYDLVSIKCLFSYWQNLTGFELEEAEYNLYIRRDVNSYIARKTDGTIKIKGAFVPQGGILKPYFSYDLPKSNGVYYPINGILKGFDCPVVALALQHYYLSQIEPEDFIYSHQDIYDFCLSQKVGGQFNNVTELVRRSIVTHRPSTTKRIKVQEKVINEAEYIEELVTLKNGNTKVKKIKVKDKEVIPAIYEEVIIEGNEYVHPKITDEVIERNKEQKTIRVFVSRPTIDNDGCLVGRVAKKIKIEDGKEKSVVYASNSFITMFNDYYPVEEFSDYNIDYDFYINKVNKIIDKIGRIN